MVIVLCLTAANATVTTTPSSVDLPVVIGASAGGLVLLILAALALGLYLWNRRRQRMADTQAQEGQQGQQEKAQPEPQRRRQPEPKKPTIEDGKPMKSIAFYEAVGAARPRTWHWQSNVQKQRAHIVGHKPGSIDNLSKDMYCSSTSCYSLNYPYQNGAFTPQWGKDGGYSRRPGSAVDNFGYDMYHHSLGDLRRFPKYS